MFQIKELKTEYRVNPLGIGTARPRFLWAFTADTDEKQTAYRVVVTSRGKTLWDSGKVASPQCVNVVYAGEPLESSALCAVAVEAWSGRKKAEASGTFETALLKDSDWTGRWAGSNAVFTDTTTVVRKDFRVEEKEVVRARVYLLGIGYHELYVNGKKVGDGYLAPSNSDYTKSLYYKTYDITPFLSAGVNAIAVELGYGWYGKKALLLQMFAEYADGTRWDDHSFLDGMWRVGGGAVTRHSIFGGETHDHIRAEAIGNYRLPGYPADWDNGWMFAFYQLPEQGVKRADQTDPIRVTGIYEPVSSHRAGGDIVYDFGQNLAGWAEITAEGARGAKITLRFAEGLNGDGSVNQLNLRTAESRDEVILSGTGRETFEPRFTYHGFQYVQVSVEGTAEICSIRAKHVHNDVPAVGAFRCSDEALNRLHRNAVMTERNNLHSVMTDCPQRDERLGWLNDLTSRIYQNINNFDLSRMIPKILQDIRDTQAADGSIADTAPFLGGTRPADPVCASYLLFGKMAYRYYGDRELLEEYYDSYAAWVSCLLSYADRYILPLSYYGDWVVPECYMDTRTEGAYMSSAYLCWQLKLMAEIAGILGREEDAARYKKMFGESGLAVNRRWFDEKKVCYANNSQTANAVALSIGFAPAWAKEALARQIREDVLARGNHNTSGNQGYRHFFYAMAEAGETQLLIDVLKNPEYPGWGYMLANGATTVWERWEKTMKLEMHSFDHPMFASYDGIFYHYLAGILVDENACACDKLTIRPQWNNELTEVHAHLDTVRGRVASTWIKEKGRVALTLTIPPTASAILDFDGEMEGKPFSRGKKVEGGTYSITAAL